MRPPVLLFAIFFLSCSKEMHTNRQANENYLQIEAISRNLFQKFTKQTFIVPGQLDSLGLSTSDIELLKYKLKCPYIQINYNEKDPAFFPADSVVIFTRTGLNIIGEEHDVIVDLRQTIRDSIPVPTHQFTKYYPIRKGMYYVRAHMPAF